MMIGTWLFILVIVILASVATGYVIDIGKDKFKRISIILVISLCLVGIPLWLLYGTASGQRSVKSFKSNVGNGLYREVIVYDITGEEIERYTGQFDVDYNSERIIFDDEDGYRHIIYYSTATVVINELENPNSNIE